MREPAARRTEAGVALLLAIWLLTVLAVLSGEFVFSGRVKLAAERNRREGIEAYALALAGYRAAFAALDRSIHHLSRRSDGVILLHPKAQSEGEPLQEKDVPLGDGTYSWKVEDEEGRFTINFPFAERAPRERLVSVLRACGVEIGADRDTIVDSILDWRDSNREHRLNGAEEDYYRSLDPPYSCKDGDFTVPEELLLVRGITPQIYYGGEKDGRKVPGLRDLVTVCPVDAAPNPHTAPPALREALGLAPTGQPRNILGYLRITATGQAGKGGLFHTLEAVVFHAREGAKTLAVVLYWNDMTSPD